jgi:hypothetical protein
MKALKDIFGKPAISVDEWRKTREANLYRRELVSVPTKFTNAKAAPRLGLP